ncbi:Flp family type IVb pilin [Aurantiacibacter luteus]|uniref:Pilus assembly protein n=1 Tax=Aurantiacibacter luteus TaxID=1581420 RepID=A0A0G9MXA2_9SPHN|nr:pilus assembly protein [Aurantiacibacter luteus]
MVAKTFFRRILEDTRGATAVEYGLIVALIVIAMITSLQGLANSTIDMWNGIETKVNASNDKLD